MQEHTGWSTPRKMGIHTTTQHSGQTSEGSLWLDADEAGDPYLEICEELHGLLSRKRGYYGCDPDYPLENAQCVADDGIEPVTYQFARIGEKVRRLRALIYQGDIEKVRETMLDIAGHAVVSVALIDDDAG